LKKADRRLTINFDLDGVIYNFSSYIRAIATQPEVRVMMEQYGEPLPPGVPPMNNEWNMEEAFGISKRGFWYLFYRAVELGVFRNGQAFPDSVEAVDYCVRRGHRVRIVTSKTFGDPQISLMAQRDVLEWLHENTPWYHKVEIVFSSDKQGYLADVIIDDKPDLSWVQDRSLNLLVAQPWNAAFEGFDMADIGLWVPGNSIFRVKIAEVTSAIQKLEAS